MEIHPLPADHDQRLARARLSLEGLSVGDAFGERFFVRQADHFIAARAVPGSRWPYTDDTEMALGICEVLSRRGRIDQDELAAVFARRFRRNPDRGYAGGAFRLLNSVASGMPWQYESPRLFEGGGSYGNGGAMRVAPLGAYFADDYAAVVREAAASAQVTHHHPEGQAGAIAVAVAAAWAHRAGEDDFVADPAALFTTVLEHTPAGDTRDGIARAAAFPLDALPRVAALQLGSGSRVSAQDTVPFCLWCAARHPGDYHEALWTTVSGLGDRDTTCAIVGGIVALSAGRESIPPEWLAAREALDLSV